MKPTPERLQLSAYPLSRTVPSRFSDVDMFRHLNNVAIGQFYEEARFAIIGEVRAVLPAESRGRVVVVNVDTAFLREAKYPGDVTVASGVVSRSAKSFVMGQGLFMDGRCFSAADTTMVYLDANGPAPMPDPLTAFLDALLITQN